MKAGDDDLVPRLENDLSAAEKAKIMQQMISLAHDQSLTDKEFRAKVRDLLRQKVMTGSQGQSEE